MEIRTKNSLYKIEGKKVLKVESGKATEVGSFVALSQRLPSGGAIPSASQQDLPLSLWFVGPRQELFQSSPIISISI